MIGASKSSRIFEIALNRLDVPSEASDVLTQMLRRLLHLALANRDSDFLIGAQLRIWEPANRLHFRECFFLEVLTWHVQFRKFEKHPNRSPTGCTLDNARNTRNGS